jgi:hypothetical protein
VLANRRVFFLGMNPPPLLRRTRCPAKMFPCQTFAASLNIALKDRSATNMMRAIRTPLKDGPWRKSDVATRP